MNGKCPKCSGLFNVTIRRGDQISNYTSSCCNEPLQGVTAGAGKGRYLCPIGRWVCTLGQTGIQIDEPMVLRFRPGIRRWSSKTEFVSEPDDLEAEYLANAAGRVFGPGCVVGNFDKRVELERGGWAGLYLAVPDELGELGNPSTWFVNEKLAYRKCAACGSQAPIIPATTATAEWRPRRDTYVKGRGRHNRQWMSTNRGPHPAGTIMCDDCNPHRADSDGRSY